MMVVFLVAMVIFPILDDLAHGVRQSQPAEGHLFRYYGSTMSVTVTNSLPRSSFSPNSSNAMTSALTLPRLPKPGVSVLPCQLE